VYLYSALFVVPHTPKALRHGSHSVACDYTNACLHLVKRSTDGASPDGGCGHLIAAYSYPTSHLANVRASDSVIYSDIARVISLRIINIIIYPERMKG